MKTPFANFFRKIMGKQSFEKNKFICAKCGGIFKKAVSDKVAEAEALEVFGESFCENLEENGAIVCDDCYNLLMNTINN